MSEELKPCPFCGGNDIAISADENQGNKWGSAVCFSCSAVGPEVRTGYETYPEASWRGEAAAEWNRRAPMSASAPAADEEMESCPLCGALPIDQVDSHAVEQHVRNRYKFSRQGLLGDCAPMSAPTPTGEEREHAMARRLIATYQFESQRADGEHAAEIVAVARAVLSSPRVERARALEEAAKVAEEFARLHPLFNHGTQPSRVERAVMDAAAQIAKAIRSLSPTDKQARG